MGYVNAVSQKHYCRNFTTKPSRSVDLFWLDILSGQLSISFLYWGSLSSKSLWIVFAALQLEETCLWSTLGLRPPNPLKNCEASADSQLQQIKIELEGFVIYFAKLSAWDVQQNLCQGHIGVFLPSLQTSHLMSRYKSPQLCTYSKRSMILHCSVHWRS